jgi:type IV pilus assembly protein PilE
MGILVLLALPNLMPLISKAKSTEAQLQLSHVHMLEKTYFYLHSTYSDNLAEIGFEQENLSNL